MKGKMINKIKKFLKLIKQKLFPNNYKRENEYFSYTCVSSVFDEKKVNKILKVKLNKGRCFICDPIKEGTLIDLHDDSLINLCPKCREKLATQLDGLWYSDMGLLNILMAIRYDYKDYISRKKLKRRIR